MLLNAWDTALRVKERYTVEPKMVKWCMRCKRSTETESKSKHKLPLAYHILHWQLHCEPSTSLTVRCCWQPKLHTAELLIRSHVTFAAEKLATATVWSVWQKQLHVFNGLFKDIGWRVCPADRWRRWGDGAWSGWCSAGGCSPVHNHLRLQSKMHTLEFTHVAAKRRESTW